ncbi:MAG: prepilin-type N-terminal cleavage/methylation domain-containing protein [bacterium]|nr:prepilin-type N-terminal cleavage/methylation domain-containing protein [Candidatus Sumerlaeota bacterium]
MNRKKQGGFTLIELLIVVAISAGGIVRYTGDTRGFPAVK